MTKHLVHCLAFGHTMFK